MPAGIDRRRGLRNAKFDENINKRGLVNQDKEEEKEKEEEKVSTETLVMIGVLAFLLIGSTFFGIISNASRGSIF